MRKLLMTCSALLCAASVAGCLTRPVVATPPAACASLIPESWKEPVAATPIPAQPVASGDPLKDALEALRRFAAAFTAESGQRAIANGRQADTVGIIERCEALMNARRPGGH